MRYAVGSIVLAGGAVALIFISVYLLAILVAL